MNISGHHPLASGRAWDRESSPVKDRRSTTVQPSQPCNAANQGVWTGSTWASPQTASRSVQSILHSSPVCPNTDTDAQKHATCDVCSNRPHLLTPYMRCSLERYRILPVTVSASANFRFNWQTARKWPEHFNTSKVCSGWVMPKMNKIGYDSQNKSSSWCRRAAVVI